MTKKIIIIRHAKSSWTDFNLSDFDRTLDDRGLKDAPVMAIRLKEAGHFPDKIITSSAVRAKNTAAYFAKTFSINQEETRLLYHGEPEDYMEQIHMLDENISCIALFGHNPGITHIANLIKPGVTDNLPTCGIIIAEMDGKIKWNNADWDKLKLINIMTPKNNE